MRNHDGSSFREILSITRAVAAASAWERARQASALRHVAKVRGDWQAANRLAQMKKEAIRLVAFLVPEQLKVTIDSDNQVGLLSVRLDGHGRLHLPLDTILTTHESGTEPQGETRNSWNLRRDTNHRERGANEPEQRSQRSRCRSAASVRGRQPDRAARSLFEVVANATDAQGRTVEVRCLGRSFKQNKRTGHSVAVAPALPVAHAPIAKSSPHLTPASSAAKSSPITTTESGCSP